MNDVVFVMANSRLKKKKKDVRKTKYYNMDDLISDYEWTMEEKEASSSLDALYEDILVEVGENEYASKGGVAVPMDDLKVPPILIMMKVLEERTLMKMKMIWRTLMIILVLI